MSNNSRTVTIVSQEPENTAMPYRVFRDAPLDQFLAGQLTEKTRKAYYADLCQFFGNQEISNDDIRRITFQDVIAFRNDLATKGYKRSSINRKLSSLKAFYKMLVAAGVVEHNPTDSSLVRGYRQEDNLAGKAISQNAMKRILRAIEEEDDVMLRERDTALFYFLTYSGLRRSEAANISWTDLHQEGAFFVLSLQETKAGVRQNIKIQPVVIHYLEKYRTALLENGYSPIDKVFVSLSNNRSHGRPLTDHAINRIVKRYAKRAGIAQNITAHMFRHTCCTLSIEGGAKPQQVQAHLRHKDLKTTMRYYENREKLIDNASDYIRIS